MATPGVRSSAIERAAVLRVGVARVSVVCVADACEAVLRAARAAPRSDWRRRTRQTPVTAARPRAAPVAPHEGGAVPDEDDRDEDAAERRPADHVRGGVGGVGHGLGGAAGGASRGRGISCGFGGGPGRGAVCGHCGLPPGSLGCGLPGFNACSTCRSLVLLDRVAVGGVFAGVFAGVFVRPRSRGVVAPAFPHHPWRHDCPQSRRPCENRTPSREAPVGPKPAVRGSNHCVTGQCSCMLPGTPRSRCGNWAEEACGRTLGGMGWGR